MQGQPSMCVKYNKVMADAGERETIDAFRAWIESAVSERIELGSPERCDREDYWKLTTRWAVEPHFWYDVTIKPTVPQVRVALMTDDPWRSRDLTERVRDGGWTLQEFVAAGLASVGLAWPEPPVEHYREREIWYYFATPVDLRSLEALAEPAIRAKVLGVVEGYHQAFLGTAVD